jgi:TonB family protein
LLDAGAEINAVSSEGWTALLLTALQGQAPTAAELLARGADFNLTFGGGFTALMVAAARGHAEVVDALLAGGMDIEATLSDGRTSLMAAAEGGHSDVVLTLLAHGADVNAAANGGSTAASSALRNGHLETAKELGKAGAVFTAGQAGLESPSEPACPRPQWPESVWELELEGQIIVEFVVDAEGMTEDSTVNLLQTPHPDLEEPAKEMFSLCEFSPGNIEGTPVRVKIRQGFNVGG